MKIICIGRNYEEHARELKNAIPEETVFFLKPDSSLLPKGKPFFYPGFSNDIHYELELVLKICRLGKNIDPEFAGKYYREIGLGIDFTARDLQRKCKEKGLPWEPAKAFDGSAALGEFTEISELPDPSSISFSLNLNGNAVQEGNSADMIFSFNKLLSHVSKFMTLKIGDLIFTGTPAGVGPVKTGDLLEGYMEGIKMLEVQVK